MKKKFEDFLSKLLTTLFDFFGKLLAVYAGFLACVFVGYHSFNIIYNYPEIFLFPFVAIFVFFGAAFVSSVLFGALFLLMILALIQMLLKDLKNFIIINWWIETIFFVMLVYFVSVLFIFQILFFVRESAQ